MASNVASPEEIWDELSKSCRRNLTGCQKQEIDIEWFAYGPVLAVITLLGVVGNTIVIYVCLARKVTSVGILLSWLAVSDTFTLLAFGTFYVPLRLEDYHRVDWLVDARNFVYKEERIFSTLYRFSKSVSTYTIVLITCQRFVVVYMPFKAYHYCRTRSTLLVLGLVTAVLLAVWVPRYLIYWSSYKCDQNCRGILTTSHRVKGTHVYKLIHDRDGCVMLIVDYALPLSALLVMNFMIVVELRRARRQRKELTGEANQDKETKMLLAVVLIFVTLETPFFLVYVLKLTSLSVKLVRVLGCLNSSLNFVVYALFGRAFRADVKKQCCCCCSKWNREDPARSRGQQTASSVVESRCE